MILLAIITWLIKINERLNNKIDVLEGKWEEIIPLLTDATKVIDANTQTVIEERRDKERDLIARLESTVTKLQKEKKSGLDNGGE